MKPSSFSKRKMTVTTTKNEGEKEQPLAPCVFLSLPEGVLYSIAAFAAPRFERAHLLCYKFALVCHSLHSAVDTSLHGVWKAILSSDYQGSESHHGSSTTGPNSSSRRPSKRLRRSPKDSVAASHQLLIERTGFENKQHLST